MEIVYVSLAGPYYHICSCICKIFTCISIPFNSLPNLDWSKLKAFADNNSDDAKLMISVFDKVRNIVGKGENAGYLQPAFSPFSTLFSKGFILRVIKTWDCVVKG